MAGQDRVAVRLDAFGGDAAAVDHRRRGNVVGSRGAPGGASGIRRCARGRIAFLYRDHDRLWLQWHPDGALVGPLRSHRSGHRRNRRNGGGLHRRGLRRKSIAIHRGTGDSHRCRQLGNFRSAPRPYFAVVHAPPRHSGGDLRQRQLSRRNNLAADSAALHRQRRLARYLFRHRRILCRDHAAARAVVEAAASLDRD